MSNTRVPANTWASLPARWKQYSLRCSPITIGSMFTSPRTSWMKGRCTSIACSFRWPIRDASMSGSPETRSSRKRLYRQVPERSAVSASFIDGNAVKVFPVARGNNDHAFKRFSADQFVSQGCRVAGVLVSGMRQDQSEDDSLFGPCVRAGQACANFRAEGLRIRRIEHAGHGRFAYERRGHRQRFNVRRDSPLPKGLRFLFEDLRREEVGFRTGTFPDPGRQDGLFGGLGEKSLAVPPVFQRHLRQEEAAISPISDQQTVCSHFDVGNLFHLD